MTSAVHHGSLAIGRPARDPTFVWLASITAVVIVAGMMMVGAMVGDTEARNLIVAVEPFESPGVISSANLPGHVQEGMARAELDVAADLSVVAVTNPPAHLLEEAVAGYTPTDRAILYSLAPYEDPAVLAGANLPGHILEMMARGEISAATGAETFSVTNPAAHLLEERVAGIAVD